MGCDAASGLTASFFVFSGAAAMVACGEAGDDGDEVFRKLLLTRRGDGVSFFDNVTCCPTVPDASA